MNKRLLFFVLAILIFLSCKKDSASTSADLSALNIPSTPLQYASVTLPAYYQAPPVTDQIVPSTGNSVTDWGATLGRVLFYDKNLSINNAVSCASCHKASNGFSDNNVLSDGFAGGKTGRHSMQLINANYYLGRRFFWDERAASLEDQVLIPIQDKVEMGLTTTELEKRINAQPHYPYLFEKAFGTKTASTALISRALSQFVRSIVSYKSKFDAGLQAVGGPQVANPTNGFLASAPFPNFSLQENRGKAIFFGPEGGCAGCHGTPTFTAPGPRNNGLDATITDQGVGGVTGQNGLRGLFKVGSLRNIELSAPYMHDGRFSTLVQVVEHYNSGVKASPTLSGAIQLPSGEPRLLNLSADDKSALVAFLKTLTDNSIAQDIRFTNPFK